ncbi:unnamed protein product [Sphacelaria rigidula]
MTTKEQIEWYASQPLFHMPKVDEFIEKTGLNTPQRYVPLAVFAAVPMFTQEFYVVDAETLLMGCFFMFLGCVVDVSHETVSKALSEKSDRILKAFNDVEEIEIKELAAELEMNKMKLGAAEDVQAIYETRLVAEQREAEMKSLMERHMHREKMVKMLDAFKAGRLKRINELRQAEVEKSLSEIVKKVESDKKLKKAALDNALMALADPASAAKVDPVSAMFTTYWKENAANMEKNKDKPVEMTAEQREKSEADIRAIFAKFGDDPTDFIKALPSTYKPSDGNLLC